MSEDKIICYCRNVSLGNILEAIENGATTLEEVTEVTTAGTGCGKCADRIKAIIEEKQ